MGGAIGVLSATEKRYIEIYAEQVKSGHSAEEVARRLGIAAITAHRAVQWAHSRGLHILDTKDKLGGHLQELGATLHKLERAFLAMDRRYRRLLREHKDVGARGSVRLLALLSERILAYRTRVMELEWIYKHVLNIQHGGEVTVRTEPDLSRLGDDELDQLERLTRRTIASLN
jgi:transposase-like protein